MPRERHPLSLRGGVHSFEESNVNVPQTAVPWKFYIVSVQELPFVRHRVWAASDTYHSAPLTCQRLLCGWLRMVPPAGCASQWSELVQKKGGHN